MKPLSFIIITYNRPADMLALAKNIAELEEASNLLEEVIILNNASTASYAAVRSFIDDCPQIPFRYIHSKENLGVARGRNTAIAQGHAPIMIMLDDDAEMGNKDCLVRLSEIYKQQNAQKPLSIVSFKVLYFDTRQVQVNAFPHKDFKSRKHLTGFETYYYAGGAHAITRESIEQVGKYPEDFFYGMEEYDLSYRILDAGFRIIYASSIVMLHKESPLGRQTKEEKVRSMWVNKCKVAWRYLPKKYFVSTALMWSMEYLRKTGFNLQGFLKGWQSVQTIRTSEKRQPVSARTLSYLREVGARLWY